MSSDAAQPSSASDRGAAPRPDSAVGSPALLFGPSELDAVRDRLGREPFAAMYRCLCEGPSDAAREEQSDDLRRSTAILTNAFRYAVEACDELAGRARRGVEELIDDPRWASSIKGLTLYAMARCVARAFDSCRNAPSWDEPFVVRVRDALRRMADFVFEDGGTQQNPSPASNWQAIRFSSAGLSYLALDPHGMGERIDACWERVVVYCRENMGDSPGSRGWNIEGLGYTFYPWPFIADFVIAAERLRGLSLTAQVPVVRWALWTIYAATLAIERRDGLVGLHPDFGDDNPHARGEGCYGLAFRFCALRLLPGIRWCYDRLKGEPGDRSWDQGRAGTIYSILFYRDDIEPCDPMSLPVWREGFVDTGGNGYFTFRNRYCDRNDTVAQLYVKARGSKGHSGPDALSFRIYGLDTPFAVGGGRYGRKENGVDVYRRSMNTLYPNHPDAELETSRNSGRVLETPLVDHIGGGHVVAAIDCSNVGVLNHRRWFVADYSGAAGVDAVYVIADTSENGHYWQLCTLASQCIVATPDNRGFTCNGADSAVLTGKIIGETPSELLFGVRPRGSTAWYHGIPYDENAFVCYRHGSPNHLVVLTLSKRTPVPEAHVEGHWPDRIAVRIGRLTVEIDGTRVRRFTDI